MIQLVEHRQKPGDEELELCPELKGYVDVWDVLVFENGLLKHFTERRFATRIVVPPKMREEFFKSLHAPAHHGYEATQRRIGQRFWWPRVRWNVGVFIKNCVVCDRERAILRVARLSVAFLAISPSLLFTSTSSEVEALFRSAPRRLQFFQ